MSEKLNIKQTKTDRGNEIKLSGQIDEDAIFNSITIDDSQVLFFDFNDIILINSCGVREWINFIDSIGSQTTIIYKNCPQIVIEQINMVHGFIKKGTKIDSFYAPYYSEAEDRVEKVLLTTQDIVSGKAPTKYSESGEELEFDAIEAQYFQFIQQMEV